MSNCSISSIGPLFIQLILERLDRQHVRYEPQEDDRNFEQNPESLGRIQGWLRTSDAIATDFEIFAASQRSTIIRSRLGEGILKRDLASEIQSLQEALEVGLANQLIYRYPDEKRNILEDWKGKWIGVLNAFPSSNFDIESGVDLWALGRATASVFHMMRVLDLGLSSLAEKFGVECDNRDLGHPASNDDTYLRRLIGVYPQSASDRELMNLLHAEAKEIMHVDRNWKDYVAKVRSHYTDDEATNVMKFVHRFMLVLSERLSEKVPE